MPNHIQHRIIADTPEDMIRIRVRLAGEEPVDFNRLIRMPRHQPGVFFAEGGLSDEDKREHGRGNWYDWSVACWGTKWGAYSTEDKRDDDVTLHFQTAWSLPMPIVCALAAAEPESSWTWEYADEDIGFNLGRIRCERGRLTFLDDPTDRDGFARELHQFGRIMLSGGDS